MGIIVLITNFFIECWISDRMGIEAVGLSDEIGVEMFVFGASILFRKQQIGLLYQMIYQTHLCWM